MTSVQRAPVIEEVTLSNSDDEIHILEDHVNSPKNKNNVRNIINKSSREIVTNKFPNKNINLTLEQVYLQEEFEVFDVPDSSDENEAIKNLNVHFTSNATESMTITDHDTHYNDTNVNSKSNMDHEQTHNDSGETDDDQFYIDEDVKDTNTACDEPIDLSLAKEDERLSGISSSIMSPSSKSDDDKLNTVLSNIETSKELNVQNDEESSNNIFKEDVEIDNASSDDELDTAERENQEISMPSRKDKQFRVRGKSHVQTICMTCHIERRMHGKLWQNKICRTCQKNLLYQCTKCKKRFSSYHSTLCHLKKECMSQKFWKCPKCSYSVLEEKKLEEHIKKVHVNGKKVTRKKSNAKVKLYTCGKCNTGFRWKSNYEKHQCRSQEIYRCQMCDYTNKIKNVVKRHFNNSHLKGSWKQSKRFSKFISKIDTRPICVPDITNSSNISNETKRKTGEETRAEQKRLNKSIALHCPKCSKIFYYNGTHIKKCEICEGPLLWQCILCDERSKSYCGIYEHLQNSCTAILKSCKKCSKTFVADDDLEKHKHICGQDLYLQCELCDYKTRIKGSFLKHVKDKHNLEGHEIRKWL